MTADTDTDTRTGRAVTSRPVLFTGLALGTAITVLAVSDGLRLNVPGVPSILRVVLGVLILWALFAAAGAVLSELTVRHHRAALRHGWRYGRRGWLAAGRHARHAWRHGAAWSHPHWQRFVAYLGSRWAARGIDPSLFRRPARREPADPGPPDVPVPPIAAGPDPATHPRPGGTMTDTPTASGTRRSRRQRGITGTFSAAWKALSAETSDYEPEDDGDLMTWMAGEVNGMSSYAEAITDVYETAVSGIGLDPVSLAALHDYADSAAEAAQAMAAARAKFAAHYAEVREFAAAGGLLPHDGRWITGEGD